MAKKGTYSAYQQQAPPPSSQFAAEGSFSRMAQRTAQKRAEERAEQRQLKKEFRQSVSNAAQMGNIDMSKINTNLHGMVGKVLDNYGEKMADYMETMDEEYSFEKQMEVQQLATEFQSKIGKFTGIGNAIKKVSSGEWDNLMAAEPQNGVTKFVNQIPEMAQQFDPETMKVGDTPIDTKFFNQVDMSKLVEPINAQETLDEFRSAVFSDAKTTETREDAGTYLQKYKVYEWDRSKAKGDFKSNFVGTQAYEKLKRSMIVRHMGIEDPEEREDFENNYMSTDGDGEAYVTEEGIWNWVVDKELEPKSKQPNGQLQKPQTGSGSESPAEDETLKREYRLTNIIEPFQGEGIGIAGSEIQVDGMTGQIEEAKKAYNPFTGKPGMSVIYNVEENMGKFSFYHMYENSLAGAQEFGHHVNGDDFDYRYLSNVHQQETGKRIAEPQPSFTFSEREQSITDILKTQERTFETVLATRTTEDDLRNAGERAFDYATQILPETNQENTAFANFVADYMHLNEKDKILGIVTEGAEPYAKGYGLNNLKVKTKLKQTIDKSKDGFEPEKEAAVLSKLMAVSRSMKAEGKTDKEIANQLVNYANNVPRDEDGNVKIPVVNGELDYDSVIPYEFDKVKNHIDSRFGEGIELASQKRAFASQLLQFGLPDSEINTALDSIDHQAVQSKAQKVYGDSFSETQFWGDVVDAANERDMSVQEYLKIKGLTE